MKYCSQFYEYLYLDHYDGRVFLCPWMEPSKACIGNLFEDTIDEAYNSERAEEIRHTMDNQTFELCRPEACPFLQNESLKEVTPEEYENLKREHYSPKVINMAFDFVCNQSCETCRSTTFIPPAGYADKMKKIKEKITPCLNEVSRITASGHGDPFASPYMMDILSGINRDDDKLSILLETNGVFADREHWERLSNLFKYTIELVVTTNSFDPFTYRHVSRNGNYNKVMDNLSYISKLRDEGKINKLTHCMVIQDRNFREIPSFIRRSLEEYSFDSVMLRPVYQWGTMPEKTFWYKDVLNPLHPYHKEYLEILNDPALNDSRVFNFGGKKVHPARPYPVNSAAKLLPVEIIGGSTRIVIYGAGIVGNALREELSCQECCSVVMQVDKCFDGQCVKCPDEIKNLSNDSYDYIIIATKNEKFQEEIREKLLSMDVEPEKIKTVL